MLAKAIGIAAEAHSRQLYNDEPYVFHPLRVMLACKTNEERIVAVLHDVIEDSSWTLEDLYWHGFSREALTALEHLTRQKETETYGDYILRVKENDLARRVKLLDLHENMNHDPKFSLWERYTKALVVLGE